jgi:UDP-2,3-diacylglucosamine pyrophosphatase LpxH
VSSLTSGAAADDGATALVADAHLGGWGGSAEPLVAQLEAAAAVAPRIVLLGDLFHVWVGRRQFETPEIAAIVACLRRLRAAGTWLEYVEGNRDFFIADGPYADAFDRVGLETSFTAGGRRYLAVHGDGLNDRDWRYRFWRRLSKSPPVRLAVERLPAATARRLVRGAEERLARTNFRHRSRIPEEAIRAYATRRLAEGHDTLLLGHFHEERRWTVPGGDIWLLDAWFRSQRVERVGAGR